MAADLVKKLGIRPGHALLVMKAPQRLAPSGIDPLPDGATLATTPGRRSYDVTLLFAPDLAAVDAHLTRTRTATRDGGLLWIAYPKRGKQAGTDLNRDILREHLEQRDLAGVSLVALDDRWSAMRFRPTAEVRR